ncbi:type II secretion system protein GspD [Pectobacterium parmentieri]|uniref:Type II secretion system protein GspD n=1 Tax=Pectobacterium parmentieri TaxID=1905730 RepID=A0A0H3I1S3_PECPM|nr:secretin N-terminal domain-containing protein [Pectobacterium parmentieri]AFI89650.1 Type IV pilus biogenesis protein PilQ [Pectobacterium parmentieri]MBI0472074.1 type II secretion system protein GspD [Pectobacterium parmentieri]MBI0495183.1 type II secretion system protein GspD [Pectobacterium parmentieri]MBI0556235.1 type II secretion system protein GspD [Pectobacterium parmentieri]MBI0569319.1 type II secretion system protein GspD [Pectobacterium parmentieri]
MKNLTVTLTLLCSLLTGCAQQPLQPQEQQNANIPLTSAALINALKEVDTARIHAPDDAELRSRQHHLTEQLVNGYLKDAERAVAHNNYTHASQMWHNALVYQPGNQKAQQGLRKIDAWRVLDNLYQQAVELRDDDPKQALYKVRQILEEDPNWPQARAMQDHLLREITLLNQPEMQLKRELRKQVSLNFRHHSLMSIMDTISQLTGVNVIYDKDVPKSMTASLVARKTTAEDALNLLLLSNQLRKKVLNGNTILIYPASPQKEKQYRDVVMKTIFLGYARAKDANPALRNLIKLRDVHIDERTNSVTIRGSKQSVEKAERLLITLDRPEAEVTLAVEVLEVYSKDIEKLGINYPGKIGVGFNGIDGKLENIAMNSLNASNMFINMGATHGISAELQKVRTNAKVLANPRIRVKNNKKAIVDIGERIPVLTSSVSDGISQEKVEYQDVGLKLEVMPEISVDGMISMDVKFQLSSQGGAERSKDGVNYYRTNNREANTVLSSQSGETQMLAGLIKMNDTESKSGIPYLSDIPGIGRLFGSKERDQERTEVVLLITPLIERNIDLPGSHVSTIEMGTEDMEGDNSLQLRGPDNGDNSGQFIPPPLAPPAQFPPHNTVLPEPLSSFELVNN